MVVASTGLKRAMLSPWTILLMLVIAVGVIAYFTMDWNGDGAGDIEPAAERDPIPVEVETVRAASLTETVRGIGTLRAFETVEIRNETAGRIRAIHFQEGGEVEEGQMLFELDDEKLRRQLAAREAARRAAEVRVTNAQRTFERQQQLRERGVVAAEQLDQAQESLDSALAEQERLEAELELTREQLQDTRITAPFTGQISERRVDRGAYVAVGDNLATVYQTDPVEINFALPEQFIGRVQIGQRVDVTVAAYPGQSFDGNVHFISPAVDQATRTFTVRARIPNPDGRLKPGAFATASVTVDIRENRPVVSAESLVATRSGYTVYVVENERAHARNVRTGLRQQGRVEILDGLELGDQVVRTGHLRLSGGERVTITDEARNDLAEHRIDTLSGGPEVSATPTAPQ